MYINYSIVVAVLDIVTVRDMHNFIMCNPMYQLVRNS